MANMWGRCQRLTWTPPPQSSPPPPSPFQRPSSASGVSAQENTAVSRTTREVEEVTFYIDGAHTKDSLAAGVRWAEEQFRTSSANPPSKEAYDRPGADAADAAADAPSTHAAPRRLLVFYCSGDRDADHLLAPLLASSQKSAYNRSLLPL